MCGITRLQLQIFCGHSLNEFVAQLCSCFVRYRIREESAEVTLHRDDPSSTPDIFARQLHQDIETWKEGYVLVQLKNCPWRYSNIKLIFPHLCTGVDFRVL